MPLHGVASLGADGYRYQLPQKHSNITLLHDSGCFKKSGMIAKFFAVS